MQNYVDKSQKEYITYFDMRIGEQIPNCINTSCIRNAAYSMKERRKAKNSRQLKSSEFSLKNSSFLWLLLLNT